MAGGLYLSSLIRLIKGEAPEIGRLRMQQILTRVAITQDEIERCSRFNVDDYARNLIYSDQNTEIFLMCWKSGHRSLIHDHGESLGGVKILRGILTETLFERAPNGMIKAVSSADYHSSDIQIEEPATIHQVSNLQPGASHAISLHIYVPPLSKMNIYALHKPHFKPVRAEFYNSGLGI
ncbi:MAG: cysteine dioxygenase [Candidatus Binatia bacterium]